MSENVEDLTIAYEEGGVEVIKELDRAILTKGAWSTIIFQYQEWEDNKQQYSEPKFSIRRYQKRYGEYKSKSKFNISSKEQAQKLIDVLTSWLA